MFLRFFIFSSLLLFLLSLSLKADFRENYDDAGYRLQLYGDVMDLYLGNDEEDHAIYYKVQAAINNYLYLGANEVFFTPTGKLKLDGMVSNPLMTLNKKKEFDYVKNFRIEGQTMEWGFITAQRGGVTLDSFFSGTTQDIGIILSVQIDDGLAYDVTLTQEMFDNETGFRQSLSEDLEEGFHVLKIKVKNLVNQATLQFINARLSGSAIVGSYVARERWRPKAIYSTFRSSVNPQDAQAWIMELSSDSTSGHFSPMTTNFGYYGPVFRADGSVGGVNMSIWSYGSRAPEPPLNELSHLLGIGSPKGVFSGWGHEGTGVKVKGWNPFETNTSKRHVLGLRFTNDGDYRTFYGYFWNESTRKWQLYSAGRKYNKGKLPLERIKTKAFIEVIGGAESERSNHIVRKVEYKGWVRDSNGVWSELDQLVLGNNIAIKNSNHGLSEDKESLFSSTGGLRNRISTDRPSIIQKDPVEKLPRYMEPKSLQDFDLLPFVPNIKGANFFPEEGIIKANVRVRTREEANVTLCWGDDDALTLEKRWDHCTNFVVPSGNPRRVQTVELPAEEGEKYLRILVRDKRAQMWSFDTYTIED